MVAQAKPAMLLPEDEHWWFSSRTQALFSLLDPLVSVAGPVLDVGGGAGNMVHHLSRYGPVVGLDNAWKPLQVAWERGYRSLPGEAVAMPFADATFSMVALLDVIEHCRDDAAVVSESHRVCRPGGLAIVTTPALSWLWSHNDVANRHYRRYSRSGLHRLLAGAGFEVIRLTYTYFLVFPAAAGLILLRKALGARTEIATPEAEDAYQVEMEATSPGLNKVLTRLGEIEAGLLHRRDLFVGTALMAVARKVDGR